MQNILSRRLCYKKKLINSLSGKYSGKRHLPYIEKVEDSKFILIISKTQLTKSTINANAIIRDCFLKGGLIDFDEIRPGEKKIMPCEILISGESIVSQVSLLIPKRRGKTQPEPRFWPYKLASLVEEGAELWFTASEGILKICDSIN